MSKENELRNDEENLEKARERFTSEIAKNIHLYDITPSAGRLYGTVFFSEKSMNLDEMSHALGMSKTSMSTGIRSLLNANMVERVWERGIRKDLYKTEDDWYKSFSTAFISRWRKATEQNAVAVKETRMMLQSLIDESENKNIKEKANNDMEKLAHAEEYYDWLNKVISLFETGEIFEIIPKKSSENK